LAEGSQVTVNGQVYDESLHSLMQTFWDLFSSERITQHVTCTECNHINTTEEPFRQLLLCFPQSHHTRYQNCTLKDLIKHFHCGQDVQNYQCYHCARQTSATIRFTISQYPTVLCIVLIRKKVNSASITLAVKYSLCGLQPSQCF
jgi:ubiquitin C-terminal hydrolase